VKVRARSKKSEIVEDGPIPNQFRPKTQSFRQGNVCGEFVVQTDLSWIIFDIIGRLWAILEQVAFVGARSVKSSSLQLEFAGDWEHSL
jgi:hypothetical protein